ncbi:hypothetical protein HUJ04_012673 [Dendroctonus ponderosae]|nr:hypothetical protein HUJ04_012673 [Dendroctonus ponderosae]KAH1029918.1 hypothetical protein HUJ05_003065 [Dendroctonus ponderosae]
MDNLNAYNNASYEQMEDIPLPVFSETNNSLDYKNVRLDTGFESNHNMTATESVYSQRVITSQPLSGSNGSLESSGNRRAIPISVINRDNFGTTFQSPINGLDLMRNADQLIIQQNCDVTDCRAFNMRLYDGSDQEAMSFKRRLGCGYCTFCFHLQKMEVWVPPGELVGTISQRWRGLQTSFEVCNRHEEVLYIIEGPRSFACFHKAGIFQIYTCDGATQIGTIVHQWDTVSGGYQLLLQMPSSITDNRHKALLLGSAFLLEYMFFESTQKKTNLGCFC